MLAALERRRTRYTAERCNEGNDPKRLATDVTNLGRWGNGDVQVALSKADDLPYVMGLVRQAFEKQMGSGETEA